MNRSLFYNSNKFLAVSQCTGRFRPFRHKTIEQLPYCVGRAAGGHPACGRMLIRPPPSFKKNDLNRNFQIQILGYVPLTHHTTLCTAFIYTGRTNGRTADCITTMSGGCSCSTTPTRTYQKAKASVTFIWAWTTHLERSCDLSILTGQQDPEFR